MSSYLDAVGKYIPYYGTTQSQYHSLEQEVNDLVERQEEGIVILSRRESEEEAVDTWSIPPDCLEADTPHELETQTGFSNRFVLILLGVCAVCLCAAVCVILFMAIVPPLIEYFIMS